MTASTRQPPAGGPKGTLRADDLVRTLHEGDHDAFIRFFRLYRAPVYHFAWRLLRDDAAAAGATRDALTAAFRLAILDDDVTDLETLTFRCALEACEAQRAAQMPEGESPGCPGRRGGAAAGKRAPHGSGSRPRSSLSSSGSARRSCCTTFREWTSPGPRQSSGSAWRRPARCCSARARSSARRCAARPGYMSDRTCRQAEEALAGAVGLGLDDDGLARLRRHAGYCRPCRKVMRTWTAAGVGLAAVLLPPPPPESLAAAPVFGDVVGPAPDAGRSRPLLLLPLARTVQALRGRAAAWVIAAACLALAGGLVVQGLGLRPVVLMQSVGPTIRLIVAPPADGSEPAAARGVGREATTTTAPAVGISGDGAAGPAAASPAGPAQPGAPADDAAPTESADDAAPPGETPSAGGSPSDTRDEASETEDPGQSASSAAADRRAADSGKAAKANGKAAKASGKAAKASGKAAKASAKATARLRRPTARRATARRPRARRAAARRAATARRATAAARRRTEGGCRWTLRRPDRPARTRWRVRQLLLQAAETINSSLDSPALEQTILGEAARLTGADAAALLRLRGDVLVGARGHRAERPGARRVRRPLRDLRPRPRSRRRRGRPGATRRTRGPGGPWSVAPLASPLRSNRRTYGTLALSLPRGAGVRRRGQGLTAHVRPPGGDRARQSPAHG